MIAFPIEAHRALDDAGRSYLAHLVEHGYVHIPRFVEPALLADLKRSVKSALDAAPFGLNERTLEPETETSRTGLGEGVDVFPIYQLPYQALKLVPGNPLLIGLMTALLGKDYYLDRSIIRKARAESPRFYFHKDQHGDIGLAILLEDVTSDEGSTSFIPDSHVGTPPTLFRVRDIAAAHPREVQMSGKAGDAFLFSRDIDHSRAPNRSGRDTVQLLYTFINKNTPPAAHSRRKLSAEDLAGLPAAVSHMLRPYPGDADGTDGSLIDRFIYQSGFSSAGAGDYDVRNDLIRDFFYVLRHARGAGAKNGQGEYYRNVTLINEVRPTSVGEYLRNTDFYLVARNLTLQFLRQTALGRRLVAWLSVRLRRAT